MSRPRLLLIEDDTSIRRFVALALDGEDLELIEAPTRAAALGALEGPRYDLVLCDLMLPDGSGLDLLREMAAPGAPSAGACRVAFSAGVTAAVRQQLLQIGVHQVLHKPVSLAELSGCVAAALARAGPLVAAGTGAATATDSRQQAIADYFGGDASLYAAFRTQCVHQFAQDANAGDNAWAAGDLAALRRLAHSLKSVLLTLGHRSDSVCAAGLESSAASSQLETSAELWGQLASRLRALAE